MDFITIKRRTAEISGFFCAHFLQILAAMMLISLVVIGIQRLFDRMNVRQQTEKIQTFDRDVGLSREQAQKLYEMFQLQDRQTSATLNLVTEMNKTIAALAENDRRQTEKVNSLKKEYQDAKQPQNKQISAVRRARVNRPLRDREDDVLRADTELYDPNAKNSN